MYVTTYGKYERVTKGSQSSSRPGGTRLWTPQPLTWVCVRWSVQLVCLKGDGGVLFAPANQVVLNKWQLSSSLRRATG